MKEGLAPDGTNCIVLAFAKKLSSCIVILLVLFTLHHQQLFAQSNKTEAFLYNVSTGAIVSGIGAIINKKKEEKVVPVLLKGFGKGLLGGGLVYTSKQVAAEFPHSGKYSYLWASKLINSAGNSIIENGAFNQSLWHNWHIEFGFNRIEINAKNGIQVQYKVMPFALYGFVYSASHAKFNFIESIKSAHPIFETDFVKLGPRQALTYRGVTVTNSITLLEGEPDFRDILVHEIIHSYQYGEFARLNTWVRRPRERWLDHQNKTVKFFERWLYVDWTYFIQGEIYRLSDFNSEDYYDNFFEKEADFYSSRHSFH